jgi:sugar phosphate isomerase/epimerase
MTRANHHDLRIGTLASMPNGASYLKQILPHGFESFELTAWEHLGDVKLPELAAQVLEVLGDRAIISSVGIYGNPLEDAQTAADWETLIRGARLFGCALVCGFAGALQDGPVDQSIPKFREVFGRLAKIAQGEGVRIAFENCDMGGTWEQPRWNIAHSPRAWEMIFDAIPGDTIGLEWEPCHQMVSLVEPIAQLRKWASKVFHVHGKDATIAWDVIREQGLRSGVPVVRHRTPGFGDTNWTDIISILRECGYRGSIDIEGWHDHIYRDDLEMTGQVYGLNYLKGCRGGAYIPNPET